MREALSLIDFNLHTLNRLINGLTYYSGGVYQHISNLEKLAFDLKKSTPKDIGVDVQAHCENIRILILFLSSIAEIASIEKYEKGRVE
ncbi:hypothetical protein [Serratia sp. N21D137]|uniref:hypothetical protein n=1 Tax=Serratia sp. N21D137 TaxID=3397495 RepID=UPI0039E0970C